MEKKSEEEKLKELMRVWSGEEFKKAVNEFLKVKTAEVSYVPLKVAELKICSL